MPSFTPPCLALSILLCLSSFAQAQPHDACPIQPVPPVHLEAARRTMASGKEVMIVALGSSSTQGWMASSIGDSYPARLQADLSHAFPHAHFAVINRGVGGQDAQEELARLDTDAIALKPDLVIWQVGANGAMRNADPAIFSSLVTLGIQRMKAAGIDVVLMDNQRAPAILASPEHALIEKTLADVGASMHVSVFSRGALMDGWQQAGMSYDRFLSRDSVHMNDLGYRCLADALARALEPALTGADSPRLSTASRAGQ